MMLVIRLRGRFYSLLFLADECSPKKGRFWRCFEGGLLVKSPAVGTAECLRTAHQTCSETDQSNESCFHQSHGAAVKYHLRRFAGAAARTFAMPRQSGRGCP